MKPVLIVASVALFVLLYVYHVQQTLAKDRLLARFDEQEPFVDCLTRGETLPVCQTLWKETHR